MIENSEERLLNFFKEIADTPKSAFSIIGVIYSHRSEYSFLKSWYKEVAGHELDIVIDALDVRECVRNYLKNKGIEVSEDVELTTEQFNPRVNENYLDSWDNDDVVSRGNSR